MLWFFLRRLASSLLLLAVVTTATFFLVFAGGEAIARRVVGELATSEAVAAKAAELGLDQPVVSQFAVWIGNALRGDLGRSWFTSEPVVDAIIGRLVVTFSIVLIVIVITAVVSVGLGMAAAVRRGWIDRLVQVLAIVGYAIPSFIIAQ